LRRLGPLVRLARLGCRVWRDIQELLDRRELPVRWDQRDRLVRLVRLALRPRFRLGPL